MPEDKKNFTKSMSVLAVDDEETITILYTKLLSGMGHRAVVANSGRATIEALGKERFDLVILDLKLPDMHGTDVLKKIQDKLDGAPVIIVTANPTLESSIEAIRTGGVYDYIVKPFKQDDLSMVISRAIEKAALTNENRRLLKKVEKANMALAERVEQLEKFAHDAMDYQNKLAELKKKMESMETSLKRKKK